MDLPKRKNKQPRNFMEKLSFNPPSNSKKINREDFINSIKRINKIMKEFETVDRIKRKKTIIFVINK